MAKTIVTHNGKFHADDVFAVAAVLFVEAGAEVIRTRDEGEIAKGDFVLDVGGIYDENRNRFDHHQRGGAGARKNGIPYAAFGLVWKKFGGKIAGGTEVSGRVEEILVTPIDANDNGVDIAVPRAPSVASYDISDAVRAFIPTWLETESDTDASFKTAVSFAKTIIEREVKRAEAVVAGRRKVEGVYTKALDKRLIILDEDISWKDTLSGFAEPLYVVHPQNGTWRLYCVRDNPHLFVNRKDLPEGWAGLRDAELARVTCVPDAVFTHRNRFMAVTKTREGAIALAKLALDS